MAGLDRVAPVPALRPNVEREVCVRLPSPSRPRFPRSERVLEEVGEG